MATPTSHPHSLSWLDKLCYPGENADTMGLAQADRKHETDLDYQEAILQQVSRTFALTIPRLPENLRTVVSNAYLLCRLADTVEDSAALSVDQKRRLLDMFIGVVSTVCRGLTNCGEQDSEEFAQAAAPLLAADTLEAERDLIRNTARVLRITRGFAAEDRAALERCVRIMAQGMDFTQQFVVAGQTVTGRWANGLPDQEHLDAYCYHVAGVVGEMLTELFCIHSQTVARHREDLSRLAVSFGEGLQLTNILADVWDDKRRNACWLPQSVFTRHGFNLKDLSEDCHGQAFQDGLADLIAVARRHLENALTYTLTIPKSEPGIRAFCLLAIGMAVLTLRRINKRRDFTSRAQVKISRRAVYATILATRLAGRSNLLLKTIFAACVT